MVCPVMGLASSTTHSTSPSFLTGLSLLAGRFGRDEAYQINGCVVVLNDTESTKSSARQARLSSVARTVSEQAVRGTMKDGEKAMNKSLKLFTVSLVLFSLLALGVYESKTQAQAPPQYPIMD